MNLLPAWHPLFVHFPLALVPSATLLLLAARWARDEPLARALATVGTWNLCLGGAGIVVAFGSGLAATLGLQLGDAARLALGTHVKWAALASFLVLVVAVWRGAGTAAASRPSRPFVAVLVLACAALVATGYRGGLNVYRHGIGVELTGPG